MCYFEGRGTVCDRVRAYACFERAAELWRDAHEDDPYEALPTDGLSRRDAAGCSIFMMGYCTLYSLLDGRREPLIPAPRSAEVMRAAALFSEAAETDHISAITALGDLSAYGLLSDGDADPHTVALEQYARAAKLASSVERHIAPHAVDAMLSLAEHFLLKGKRQEGEGDRDGASHSRAEAWRYLASASELGSADALVGMAYCAYFGYGTPENRDTAAWFLRRAEHSRGGHRLAALFTGDLLYASGTDRAAAMAAYRRAATVRKNESKAESVTLAVRRRVRDEADERVRTEALYRLAAFQASLDDGKAGEADGACACSCPSNADDTLFAYLLKAVLAGHDGAVDDLSRMFAHEVERRASVARATPVVMHSRSRRARATRDSLAAYRDQMTLRPLTECMTDYYAALWLGPVPFERRVAVGAVDSDLPDYVTAPVSAAMRAEALNYLGDCCFFGHGLPEDAAAAVACYTAAVAIELGLRRGECLPDGVAWAHYSLGWCQLRGVGCTPNPCEAVRHFRAAPHHAEACFALATCCEGGVGMDAPDLYEAFKHYRRAHKLGHPEAALRIRRVEQQLR